MKTSISTRLFPNLPALAFGAMLLASAVSGWGQTYYNMSSGDYTNQFTSITNWPTNFNGTATNATGSIPAATRITTASTTLTTNAAPGSTGIFANSNLIFLTTGTTDNTAAVAADLNLNFSGRAAGALNAAVSAIANSTGNRVSTLRAYYSTDGTTWTELTGSGLPFLATNNVAGSTNVSLTLPSALNNQSTVKIRFYSHNGSGGATGNRPRITLDNLGITSTSIAPTITGATTAAAFVTTYGTASAVQSFSISGSNLTADLVATAPTGFEVSSDGTNYGGTATFAQSGGLASGSLRIRLKADAAVGGSYNSQDIVLSSTGAASVNIATASSGNSVSAKALTITGLTAENKNWDGTTSVSVTGSPAYSGLANGEMFSVSGTVTWAFADANVGTNKPLTRTGSYDAPSANYTVTHPTLTANISAVAPGAPTITGVTPGNQILSVAFTAPGSNGGASISNYEYSIDGGNNWVTPSPAVTSSPLLISGLTNGTPYDVQLRAVNSAGSGAASATTSGTPLAPTSPTIAISPATLSSSLTTTYGAVSSAETFTVAGSALSGDVTVTAPTGLEVSLSAGSGYADSLNLTPTSGGVSLTTIHVRLKATAAAGSYNSQNITLSGGGATSQNVSTSSSGNTVAQASLTISGVSVATKEYDGTTSATVTGSASYSGLQNGESFSVTGTPTATFGDKNAGSGKSVTVSGYTAPSDNYTVTQPSPTGTITTKPLSITAPTIASRAFNNTTAAGAVTVGTLSGFVGTETVTATGSAAAYSSADVGTYSTMVSYTLADGTNGGLAANYSLTNDTASGEITKANQAITGVASTASRIVGDVYLLGGAASSGLPLSYSSSNPAVATVNSSGSVTVVGAGTATLTVSQAGDSNYNAAPNITQALTAALPPIWTNPITDTNPSASNPYTTGDVKDANITVSGISRGTGISASSAGNRYSASGWNSANLDANDYFQFTITPSAGYQVSFTSFVYTSQASAPTGMSFAVRSSVDNYASNVGTATAAGTTIDLSGASFQNVSGAITFRLFAWGADTGARTFSVNDFSFNGSVSVLPPSITINSGTSATATAFSTTYGTVSTAQTFTIAGSNLTADVTATAPTGFEVSSDGTTYGSTATFTRSGASVSGTLRLRLAATAGVGGGYDSQTLTLSSTGATTRNITTASTGNTVTAKGLTITGLTAENKNWDGTTTASVTGTPAYSGLANDETFSVTDSVTWAFPDANVGTGKTLTRTGSFSAPSANYTVTQPILTANISAVVTTAPTIDSVVGGNGQLSVAFSDPSSNGGASITNYEYSTNGGSTWTARSPANTASPLIIGGLINGTTYDVQLRAVNSAGSGAASTTTQGAPVAPALPTITVSKANLTPKTTTYGTPSASETFTVSGATLTSGDLTVIAPTGFEVSTDGTTYSSSVNLPISGDAVAETTIYARLAATAAVSGSYNSQNITVSGGSATTQNVVTASSGNVVSARTLTITGLSAENKAYDGTTSVSVTGTPEYAGLANGETFSVAGSVTWAFPNASVGNTKPLTRTGDYDVPSSNYTVTQPTLSADITQATAPNLTAATNATVDNPFDVTFNETSSLWRSSITSITVSGTTLSTSAYNTTVSGKITFNPANSALLQSAGSKSIVILATGYNNATVTQSIGAGSPMQLSVVTQPTAPATNGAALAAQPVVRLLDLYNNVTTNSDTVTAAATQTNWALGGTTNVAAVSGTATFSGLTATSAAAVTNATITFASGSLSAVSSSFNLSAPPAPNDGTGTAISLTVNAAATAGSFTGSTPTFSTISTNNDVWYKFVATSTSHTLTATASSSSTDPDIRVYEGTGSSFNTPPTAYSTPTPLVIGQLAGDPEETVIATNFVVGRTYFVMVQDFGNVGGSFGIRVRTASPSIATWNPAWSGTAASPLNATSKDANVDTAAVARAGSLAGASSSNRYSSSAWNSANNYLTFTLTAATGYRLDLNDQVLYGNWAISGTSGPGWYEVRSSVDNYASIIGYFDVLTSNAGLLGAIKLPNTGYSGLNSVTFRVIGSTTPLSGTGNVASTATGGFTAFRVTGTLIQLPVVTPATVAGTVGTPLSYNISATGTPTSYAISSGTLPSGLSLDTTTGVISGTPSAAGDGTIVSVTASNSAGTSTAANLTFNIAKETPSITSAPTASAITYGQTLADSVLSGGTASVAGSFAFTTPSTAPNAGTTSQNVTFTPTDTANYSTATTTVSVTADQKVLTITADAKGKTYGDGDPALTYASSGLVGSDVISGSLTRASGENVGIYAINQGTLTAGSNYSISFTGANFTINTASLPAVSFTAPASLTYDATAKTYLASATGPSSLTLNYTGRGSTVYDSSTAPTNVGDYTVTATTTDGNYTGSQTQDFSIAAKALTITGATATSRAYDGTTTIAVNGGSLEGVESGDVVTLGGSPTGTIANAAAETGKIVAVSGYSIDGASVGNYSLSQPTGLTVDITQRALTITGVTASNKVYDATTTAILDTASAALSGVIPGDTVDLIIASASGAFADKMVGTAKPVSASGFSISGADSGNYSLSQPTGIAADITAKALTITGVTASNKVFDTSTTAALNTAAAALSGVVDGDTVILSAASAAGSFGDANVGTAKTVTTSGFSISGSDSGNYSLTQPITSANIDKATPTITASPTASNLDPGQSLSLSSLTGGSASVAGAFAWTAPGTIVSATGSYSVTFTPTDTANYNTASALANVTVNLSGYNAWAQNNGLTGDNALGSADPDKDGFINSAEYAFGTRPNVADGSLVNVVVANGVFRTSWNGPATGVTYGVQSSTNLSTMAFSNDPTVTIQTNNGVLSFTNPPSGNKFFRVRATSSD